VWNFGDESASTNEFEPTHTFPDDGDGTYLIELIAYSPLGCPDTAWQIVHVKEEVIFYVPNTFTPDFDDFNETFKPVFTAGYDPFDYTLLIFDRWGEIIWESHNAQVGWDGTYANSYKVQDGTYVWKIEFKTTSTDERIMVTGHVNVIR
jgi:gliding motility-associated-like protein